MIQKRGPSLPGAQPATSPAGPWIVAPALLLETCRDRVRSRGVEIAADLAAFRGAHIKRETYPSFREPTRLASGPRPAGQGHGPGAARAGRDRPGVRPP